MRLPDLLVRHSLCVELRGCVLQEFFQLLTDQLLNPDFGM